MSDSALYRIIQSRARLPSLFLLGTFSLLLLCLSGHGQDQQAEEESTSAHQLMFIPPPEDGVISLGVYDNDGKLIRILKKAADIDSFKSGLNGLFIDWDGKDSNGAAAPVGKYSARGILVGEVNISGQAYHLNDWVDPSGSLQTRRILSAVFLTGKTVCAFAEAGTGRALLI
ncbi:MAG TPA: hypothetical protein VE242_05110, partial [Chthoniobacterales bacterium]|nr:hypothetical protein [Chthoniobacterales bacterium]